MKESRRRQKRGLPVVSHLHVYRIRKPIRNLFLFADAEMWADLGGMESHYVNEICGIPLTNSPEVNKEIKRRATLLSCPVPEYLRAKGVQQYRIVRGERGERVNGWIRVNATSVYNGVALLKSGFELLFTNADHGEFLEHVRTFEVVNDAHKFGVTSQESVVKPVSDLLWYTSADDSTEESTKPRRKSVSESQEDKSKRRLSL